MIQPIKGLIGTDSGQFVLTPSDLVMPDITRAVMRMDPCPTALLLELSVAQKQVHCSNADQNFDNFF